MGNNHVVALATELVVPLQVQMMGLFEEAMTSYIADQNPLSSSNNMST